MVRLLLLLALLAVPAAAETRTGPVRVVDADTIDIGGPVNIRLLGIDAAERDQTCRHVDGALVVCGRVATEGARRLYEGRRATCDWRETDRYGRALAVCRVDGRDINAELVWLGLARRYRGDGTYFEEEKEARLLARGLWAYEMADPSVWRAGRRRAQPVETAPSGECAIKGNVSANGRLYHLPGSRSYGPTRIDERRGERWFCDEDEARAAGWVRAGS